MDNVIKHWRNGLLVKHAINGVPQPIDQSIRPPARSLTRPHAIPESDWPLWAKAIKRLAKPEDRGIGDVLHRTIGPKTAMDSNAGFKATFNKDCGYAGRQARYNRLYPLNQTTDPRSSIHDSQPPGKAAAQPLQSTVPLQK